MSLYERTAEIEMSFQMPINEYHGTDSGITMGRQGSRQLICTTLYIVFLYFQFVERSRLALPLQSTMSLRLLKSHCTPDSLVICFEVWSSRIRGNRSFKCSHIISPSGIDRTIPVRSPTLWCCAAIYSNTTQIEHCRELGSSHREVP